MKNFDDWRMLPIACRRLHASMPALERLRDMQMVESSFIFSTSIAHATTRNRETIAKVEKLYNVTEIHAGVKLLSRFVLSVKFFSRPLQFYLGKM